MESVLQLAGVAPEQIDVVAVGEKYAAAGVVPAAAFSREVVLQKHRAALSGPRFNDELRNYLYRNRRLRAWRRRQQYQARRSAFQALFPQAQIVMVEHHECHAAGAYYGWGKLDQPILVLTADGEGDDLCASVSRGEDGRLTRLAGIERSESLGWPYEAVTFLLGMQPLEHEYKVMGLAPYGVGSPQAARLAHQFRSYFDFEDDGISGSLTWRRRAGVPRMNDPTRFVSAWMQGERFDHVAGAIQEFTETAVISWVRRCIKTTGISRLALSGGLFMNVKMNGRILELPEVEELFVMPACTDASNSIGAAYSAYAQARHDSKQPVDSKPLGSLYLGEEISDEQVRQALVEFGETSNIKLEVQWPQDPERVVAELLVKGEIVARAKGRMEFGPRALGNRSILADPAQPGCVRIINQLIKSRDFWMPFAPTVPVEDADRYVVKPPKQPAFVSPYMMMTYPARAEKISAFPAAMHPADNSARLQELSESFNPDFYRLLAHFKNLKGESIILNTSFNLHGFPIVRTAGEALHVLENSQLRYLQLGNAIVFKAD